MLCFYCINCLESPTESESDSDESDSGKSDFSDYAPPFLLKRAIYKQTNLLKTAAKDVFQNPLFQQVLEKAIVPMIIVYATTAVEHMATEMKKYPKYKDMAKKLSAYNYGARTINKFFNPTVAGLAENIEFVAENNGTLYDAFKMTAAKISLLHILDILFKTMLPSTGLRVADMLVYGLLTIGGSALAPELVGKPLDALLNKATLTISQGTSDLGVTEVNNVLTTVLEAARAVYNLDLRDYFDPNIFG